ncbi:MAG TPA: hypothetical protein VGB17_18440 [Pyrinomonadaceae bacterium]|jgi:hypothetical protein
MLQTIKASTVLEHEAFRAKAVAAAIYGGRLREAQLAQPSEV